jgi:conjugal transfer/entry exclusion protein
MTIMIMRKLAAALCVAALAAVLLVGTVRVGEAQASCCSTVFDPQNYSANSQSLVKEIAILEQAIQQVKQLTDLNSLLGTSGLLNLSSLPGLSQIVDLSKQLSSLSSSVNSLSSSVSSLASGFSLSSVIGQSLNLSSVVPNFSNITLPTGVSTSSLKTFSGAQSFVSSVLRGSSRITSASEGGALEARRATEYRSAVDDGHASALYALQAVSSAKDRVSELTKMASEAQSASDMRTQSAAQMAAINAALIAIVEEEAGIRQLLAAQIRVNTGAIYAATRGIGQNNDSTNSTVPSSWQPQ